MTATSPKTSRFSGKSPLPILILNISASIYVTLVVEYNLTKRQRQVGISAIIIDIQADNRTLLWLCL